MFAIDRGGTFTDCVAFSTDGRCFVEKLLSQDPKNYEDATVEGIRRLLNRITGEDIPRGAKLPSKHIRLFSFVA